MRHTAGRIAPGPARGLGLVRALQTAIGARLFISEGTVENHLRKILNKVLPAAEIVKRQIFQVGDRRFALDLYEGRHQGLSNLEVGVDGADLDVSPPEFAGLEVTRNERFIGGWLAAATRDEVTALLNGPVRTSTTRG